MKNSIKAFFRDVSPEARRIVRDVASDIANALGEQAPETHRSERSPETTASQRDEPIPFVPTSKKPPRRVKPSERLREMYGGDVRCGAELDALDARLASIEKELFGRDA